MFETLVEDKLEEESTLTSECLDAHTESVSYPSSGDGGR